MKEGVATPLGRTHRPPSRAHRGCHAGAVTSLRSLEAG